MEWFIINYMIIDQSLTKDYPDWLQNSQIIQLPCIKYEQKEPLSKTAIGLTIQKQEIEPLFWIQIQIFNFIHRLAMINISQSIYRHNYITRLQYVLTSTKSFQVLFQINLQDYSQDKQKQLKHALSLYGITIHNYHSHQWYLKKLTRQYSFTELISQINRDYSLINFSNFSSLPNYKKQDIQNLKVICKKYGINIQILDDQYYFAFTQDYDNNDWNAVLKLKVNRSGQKNFKKVAQLVESLMGEFIVQCGKQINIYIQIQCEGIKRLINILRQIIDKKIMKYYHDLTITSKTSTQQDIKKFKINDEDLLKLANYFCKNYHKNTENKKDEQQVDWSDIFSQPQSKKILIHQKLKTNFSDFTKDDLERLTKEYGRSNLLFLKGYWQSGLQEYIINLYKHWSEYNGVYIEEMRRFIYLLDYKSFEIKQKYESFYPKSIPIMKAFMSKLKITSLDEQIKNKIQNVDKNKNISELSKLQRDRIRDECLRQRQRYLQISQHLIDNIIKYLIVVQTPQRKNEKFKLSIPGQLLKNKTVSFANLISVLQQFQAETSKWQDALHVVFKDIQKLNTLAKSINNGNSQARIQNSLQKKQYQELKKKDDAQNAYFDGIQYENLPRLNCLGCTRHFLFNMNIFDNSVNRGKLIVFQKADIINEINGLKQIIKAICSLLNDNQGGVILFNCQKKYQDVLTLGCVITEDMKKQLKDKIHTLQKRIYPSSQQNITVNFVPVIANPYSVKPFEGKQLFYNGVLGDIKQKKYIRRKFYEGTYVMRVIVKPTDQSQVFFYEEEDKLLFSKYKDNKIVELSISQLHKSIKQKMSYFISQQYSFMSRNMLMMPSPFDHICQKPDEGVKVNVRYDMLSPQIKNKWEESFQFVTHLEINKKEVPNLQLTLTELNIRCEIQSKFQQYQFCPKNCAIMYHDIPLDALMKIINHHNSFARLKKQIKMSQISSYLKLLNRDQNNKINYTDIKKYNRRLTTEFNGSLMHLYELYFGQTITFYVAGNSKVQNLFIFLMMNYFKQIVQFEQKPTDIIQANQCCWKEIYNPDTINQSQRIQINEIYDVLKENLKDSAKKVYEAFYKALKEDQYGQRNIIYFQTRFLQYFNILILNDDLTQWQENMLKFLDNDRNRLLKILLELFQQNECIRYLGIKVAKLWLKVMLENENVCTFQLLQKIEDYTDTTIVPLLDFVKQKLLTRHASKQSTIKCFCRRLQSLLLQFESQYNQIQNVQKIQQLTSKLQSQTLIQGLSIQILLPNKYIIIRHIQSFIKEYQICQPWQDKHYISFKLCIFNLLDYLQENPTDKQMNQLRVQLQEQLLNHIYYLSKQLEKIRFSLLKQSYWILRTMRHAWFFEQIKQFSTLLYQAHKRLRNLLKKKYQNLIDEFLSDQNTNKAKYFQYLSLLIQQLKEATSDQEYRSWINYRIRQVQRQFLDKYYKYFQSELKNYISNSILNNDSKDNCRILPLCLMRQHFRAYLSHSITIDSPQIIKKYELALQETYENQTFTIEAYKQPNFMYQSKAKDLLIKIYKQQEENLMYLTFVSKYKDQKPDQLIRKKLKGTEIASFQSIKQMIILNNLLISSFERLKKYIISYDNLIQQYLVQLNNECNEKITKIIQIWIIAQFQQKQQSEISQQEPIQLKQRVNYLHKQCQNFVVKCLQSGLQKILVSKSRSLAQSMRIFKDNFLKIFQNIPSISSKIQSIDTKKVQLNRLILQFSQFLSGLNGQVRLRSILDRSGLGESRQNSYSIMNFSLNMLTQPRIKKIELKQRIARLKNPYQNIITQNRSQYLSKCNNLISMDQLHPAHQLNQPIQYKLPYQWYDFFQMPTKRYSIARQFDQIKSEIKHINKWYVSKEDKIQLLLKIIAAFNSSNYQFANRRKRWNFYNYNPSCQSPQFVDERMRRRLIKSINYPQKYSMLIASLKIQEKVIFFGIRAIYLSIVSKKQVNIISGSNQFLFMSSLLFKDTLRQLQLEEKILYFDYDDGIKHAFSSMSKAYHQSFMNLYQFKGKDKTHIEIISQLKKPINYPKEIFDKILMIEQMDGFFFRLEKQRLTSLQMPIDDKQFQNIIQRIYEKRGLHYKRQELFKEQSVIFFCNKHPLMSLIMIQELCKMVVDSLHLSKNYAQIDDKIIYNDSNGRLNEQIKYGYKELFNSIDQLKQKMFKNLKINLIYHQCPPIFLLKHLCVEIHALTECLISELSSTSIHMINYYQMKVRSEYGESDQTEKEFNYLWAQSHFQFAKRERYQQTINKKIKNMGGMRIIMVKNAEQIESMMKIIQSDCYLDSKIYSIWSFEDRQNFINRQDIEYFDIKTIILITQQQLKELMKELIQIQPSWLQRINILCNFAPNITCLQRYETYVRKIDFCIPENEQLFFYRQKFKKIHSNQFIKRFISNPENNIQPISFQMTQKQFIKHIAKLNRPLSKNFDHLKAVICINGCSSSLISVNWQKFINSIYHFAQEKQRKLFAKIIVYRGTSEHGRPSIFQSQFADDPQHLIDFVQDIVPFGTYHESNIVSAFSSIKDLGSLHNIFVIQDNILAKYACVFSGFHVKLSEVKLFEINKLSEFDSEEKLNDYYQKNQKIITKTIQDELQQSFNVQIKQLQERLRKMSNQ